MSAPALRLSLRLRGLTGKRQSQCRHVRCAPSVSLVEKQSRLTGECRLVVRGITTCGSVHSCPACAEVILRKRAEEVRCAVATWGFERCRMVTLTLRHKGGESLCLLQRILAVAWGELKAGRPGARLRERLGWHGDVRGAEQTHGAHGWHPHLHAVMFLHSHLVDSEALTLLAERWRDSVSRVVRRMQRALERSIDGDVPPSLAKLIGSKLYKLPWHRVLEELEQINPEPDIEHGCVVSAVNRADYLVKLGLEVSSVLKTGRKEAQRTSWQIAQDAARGCASSRRLWSDHYAAMKGARQLTWSRGIRDELGLGAELQDVDVAADGAEVLAEDEREIALVQPEVWDARSRELRQEWTARIHDAYMRDQLSQLVGLEPIAWREVLPRASSGEPDREEIEWRARRRHELSRPPRSGTQFRSGLEKELWLEECREELLEQGVIPW